MTDDFDTDGNDSLANPYLLIPHAVPIKMDEIELCHGSDLTQLSNPLSNSHSPSRSVLPRASAWVPDLEEQIATYMRMDAKVRGFFERDSMKENMKQVQSDGAKEACQVNMPSQVCRIFHLSLRGAKVALGKHSFSETCYLVWKCFSIDEKIDFWGNPHQGSLAALLLECSCPNGRKEPTKCFCFFDLFDSRCVTWIC